MKLLRIFHISFLVWLSRFVIFTFMSSIFVIWGALEVLLFFFIFCSVGFWGESFQNSLIYFITQGIASSLILLGSFWVEVRIMGLSLKIIIFPWIFWIFKVLKGLKRMGNIFFILTFQKLPPLLLIKLFSYSKVLLFLLVVGILIIPLWGLLEKSFIHFIIFSSLVQTNWLILRTFIRVSAILIVFSFYSMVKYFIFFSWGKGKSRWNKIIRFLFIYGCPPLLIFLIKVILLWIVAPTIGSLFIQYFVLTLCLSILFYFNFFLRQ